MQSVLTQLLGWEKGQPAFNQSFEQSFQKEESKPPVTELGIAILETMNKTGLTYDGLTQSLEETSRKIQTKASAKKKNLFPVLIIIPSTLHSYTASGSTRTTKSYDLAYVLSVLKKITKEQGQFENKWVEKEDISEKLIEWMEHPLINNKQRNGKSTSALIQEITGLNRQQVSDCKKGRYKKETEKWLPIEQSVTKWIEKEERKEAKSKKKIAKK